MFQRNANI